MMIRNEQIYTQSLSTSSLFCFDKLIIFETSCLFWIKQFYIYIIRTKANLLMRKGIDPKLKNTLVASLAPADSNDLMQPPLIKSNSSAKNERGRASIRGLSNQIGAGIKNSA